MILIKCRFERHILLLFSVITYLGDSKI